MTSVGELEYGERREGQIFVENIEILKGCGYNQLVDVAPFDSAIVVRLARKQKPMRSIVPFENTTTNAIFTAAEQVAVKIDITELKPSVRCDNKLLHSLESVQLSVQGANIFIYR